MKGIDFNKILLTFLAVLTPVFLVNCASKAPDVDFCTIYSTSYAMCTPVEASRRRYNVEVQEMIAYTCTSPTHTGKIRTYISDLLEEAGGSKVHSTNVLKSLTKSISDGKPR